jgi:uncharacterized Zn-binding protein involved in type VI secretion
MFSVKGGVVVPESLTVTCALPAVAISAAETCAISSYDPLDKAGVVDRGDPFHCTTEELVKPAPRTVSKNGEPPAATLVGDSDSSVKVAGLTVKVSGLGLPFTGSSTETGTLPAAATSAAEIRATSWVVLKTVVGRGIPFHNTTVCGPNCEPFTRSKKSGPEATAELGDKELS